MTDAHLQPGLRVRTKTKHLATSDMGFTEEERRANRRGRRIQLYGVIDRLAAPRFDGSEPTYVWVQWDGASACNPVQKEYLEREDARAVRLDD